MMGVNHLPVLWQDTGCDLHPACLSCPLPRCRYDEPYDRHAEERADCDAHVLAALAEGVPRNEVMERFNISNRTLLRVIQQRRSQ